MPAHQSPIEMLPSEYFRRQCLISADRDESVTPAMVEHMGAAYFLRASDYPRIDASFGVGRELKGTVSAGAGRGEPESSQVERAAIPTGWRASPPLGSR